MDETRTCPTGYEPIDQQHKVMGVMIAAAKSTLESDSITLATAKEVYESLRNYVLMHFRFEEYIMRQHAPSELQRTNIDAHRQLVSRLDELGAMLARDYIPPVELVTSMLALMEDWVAKHICAVDCQLKKWRKEAPQA